MLLITQLSTSLRKLTRTVMMHNCRVKIGNTLCYTKCCRITLNIAERAIIDHLVLMAYFVQHKLLQIGWHYIFFTSKISQCALFYCISLCKYRFIMIFIFLYWLSNIFYLLDVYNYLKLSMYYKKRSQKKFTNHNMSIFSFHFKSWVISLVEILDFPLRLLIKSAH